MTVNEQEIDQNRINITLVRCLISLTEMFVNPPNSPGTAYEAYQALHEMSENLVQIDRKLEEIIDASK